VKRSTITRLAAAVILAVGAAIAGIEISGLGHQAKAKIPPPTHVRFCLCIPATPR
jgi:hypothetical protein